MTESPGGALPLAGYGLFETGDVDEARECVARVFSAHRLAPVRGPADLDAHHNRVDLGGVSVNYLRYGATVSIDPGELGSYYLLQLPLAGGAEITCGGESVSAGPRRGTLLGPAGRVRMCWSGDCGKLLVQVRREVMSGYVQALLGGAAPGVPRFDLAVPMDAGPGRMLMDTVRFVTARLDADPAAAANPLVAAQLRQMLLSALVCGQAGDVASRLLVPEQGACPRYVRRAEEYIEAHAAEALPLEDVARACAVSARALQQGFRSHRGCTPMGFLREVRLRRVHAALADADPDDPPRVGEVALAWGFAHFGRFAARYRERFGEPPSQTLARARR